MTGAPKRSAVFLDRDGVLNRNVFYADSQAYESPRSAAELVLVPGVGQALRALREAGYLLLLVSNQPNAVKGKCSREALDAIHTRLVELLGEEKVTLDAAYYCYHHPEHTGPCACRKPSPYFLEQAMARFDLDRSKCWMVGDRATDIACGRAAGVHTVWIDTGEQTGAGRSIVADLRAKGLAELSRLEKRRTQSGQLPWPDRGPS